jgi:glyoxylase-like metal-dependent hydrolase (beta-lactamase superfamily II)
MASMAEKILPMDDDVAVLPGHGPATTIGRERRTNPFILELLQS